MARVVIEIIDQPNGRLEIRAKPSGKEMANAIANLNTESNAFSAGLFVLAALYKEAKAKKQKLSGSNLILPPGQF